MAKARSGRYTPAIMSQPSDLEDWAKRYLDLWQDQVSAMASDPAVSQWLSAPVIAQAMTASRSTVDRQDEPSDAAWLERFAKSWLAAIAASAPASDQSGSDQAAKNDGDEDGAKTAAAPSRHGGDDMASFSRRLAQLERRIARLESDITAGTGSAAGGGRKTRSGGSRKGGR